MSLFDVPLEVLGRDETFTAVTTLVLRLHHVNLRLGVSIQVRLRHAFVVAQLAVELANTCRETARTNLTSDKH